MRDMIRAHIDYDALVQEYDRDRLDEMVSLMAEERICSLNSCHIGYAIKSMNETGRDIRNIKHYLLAVLFNTPATMNNHYDAMIRRDRWEPVSKAEVL